MREEVLSLLENRLPRKQQAEKIKTFHSLCFGAGEVAFGENSNVPTSEGKVLMETYFKTFPELAAFSTIRTKRLSLITLENLILVERSAFNKPKNGYGSISQECRYELPSSSY
jgi:hypothetical protein